MGLFGNIIGEIQGAIDSLTNIFGGSTGKTKYPDISGIDTRRFTNVPDYRNKDWKESRGYGFQVYRILSGGKKEEAGWKELRLQINPQELQQDEIFAIEVTPTLRGVLVEHHGAILKDIVISGTTGISPLRREGGADPRTGRPIMQSGHSGFEEFHELRSYIRAYVEAKRLDTRQNGELRLVFKNFKDSEFLFVEPMKFSMKRSAQSPLMYGYSIALKGIGVSLDHKKDEASFFENIDTIIDTVADYLEIGQKIIVGSIGIVSRIERDVTNTIIIPITKLIGAVRAVGTGVLGFTRAFVDDLKKTIEVVESNLNDAFGRDTSDFNTATGKTQLFTGSGRETTYQELQVLNAFGSVKRGLLLLAAQEDPFFAKNVYDANKDAIAGSFGDKYTFREPKSVRQVRILGNDDIQTIAARELGNVDTYRDIVLLNSLKPPYIDISGGNGVLKPGDLILIPQQSASNQIGVLQNKQYNITRFFNFAEKNLGVDLRLNADGDLILTNASDFSLVAGVENLVQAIGIRLLLERGSLKRHPSVGTNLQIGSKTTNIAELRDQIVGSLATDPRIESIPFVQLFQESGTTRINMILKIKQLEQPVPIPLSLPN